MTTREFADRVGKNPLEFEPSSNFMYGVSADILGALIEVISGMSFAEFLKKEITDPLEMPDTGFSFLRKSSLVFLRFMHAQKMD